MVSILVAKDFFLYNASGRNQSAAKYIIEEPESIPNIDTIKTSQGSFGNNMMPVKTKTVLGIKKIARMIDSSTYQNHKFDLFSPKKVDMVLGVNASGKAI